MEIRFDEIRSNNLANSRCPRGTPTPMRFPWQRGISRTGLPIRKGRSDNLYRRDAPAAATAAAPGRSRINIRWLISFRGDQGVAFLKFPANCPPRAIDLFSSRPSGFVLVPSHYPVILFPVAEGTDRGPEDSYIVSVYWGDYWLDSARQSVKTVSNLNFQPAEFEFEISQSFGTLELFEMRDFQNSARGF